MLCLESPPSFKKDASYNRIFLVRWLPNSYLFFIIGGPLEQSDLQSKDSFIIDNGAFGLWVWVGKKASSAERTEAMRNAQGFIKKKGK